MSNMPYTQRLAGGSHSQSSRNDLLEDVETLSDDLSMLTCSGSPDLTTTTSNIASDSQCLGSHQSEAPPAHPSDMRSINEAELSSETTFNSVAASLPVELVQIIYGYLGPTDFNAARYTCHSWMLASLNHDLLVQQIKRGGWWSSVANMPRLSREWRPCGLLSSFLTRECALAGTNLSSANGTAPMATESATPDGYRSLVVASLYGGYTATAHGATININRLEGSASHPFAVVDCEQAVVAMSITTDPLFLGVLLVDRVGVLVNLGGSLTSSSAATLDIRASGGLDGDNFQPDGPSRDVSLGSLDELSLDAGSTGSRELLHHSVVLGSSRTWSEYVRNRRSRVRGIRAMRSSRSQLLAAELDPTHKGKDKAGVLAMSPSRIYRNVCWENDPPLSVAVSPNGQCVAFGSAKGVELYWEDINTGQSMNRYFSLTRPSEVLHFLPPRRSIDSPHKLRLISSPGSAPGTTSASMTQVGNIRPWPGTWFTLAGRFRSAASNGIAGHCRAVPLSDGHHMMFTDEETGRFVLEPPPGNCSPYALYAAASNLESGARIAVAYDDDVVLYSVPIDALRYSTAQQEETLQPLDQPFAEMEMVNILRHPTSNAAAAREALFQTDDVTRLDKLNMLWAHWLPALGEHTPEREEEIWPLSVPGVYVGSLEFPVALAVRVDTAVTVWAFGQDGLDMVWSL
ncbi:hypothetical protein LTR48_001403 [Friedmanniomyces endolithicus]|uniref:F-box domain-containing protein n=1 Tax=Rachicladosporium monterosium TaxID=1507873 RepID=A0ABR0LEX6_9PEZI|nr:hypothetical protein LTR48_001403 [Friedmanniomyces endolithicus]KAK5147220.1 hypothetical protein LTR32_001310 [Rachicladosporium monterosium]